MTTPRHGLERTSDVARHGALPAVGPCPDRQIGSASGRYPAVAARGGGAEHDHQCAMRTGMAGGDGTLQHLFETLDSFCPSADIAHLKRSDFTLVSARSSRSREGESGEWELLRLAPGMFVICTNTRYDQPTSFLSSGEDFIEFHFRLSGRLQICPEDGRAGTGGIDVDKGTLLVWRHPPGSQVVNRLFAEEREASITIYLRPDTLKEMFGDCADALPEDVAVVLGPSVDGLFSLQMALYPRIIRLLHELAASTLTGSKRLVQAEAMTRMILCEVIGMMEAAHHASADICRMTDTDVACLHRARDLILSHHTPPMTINDVARSVGMGATKLKSGFKRLYGKSISQYANDLRMRLALDLLLKADLSILHVAEALGYDYQNSFTVAFRRRFNVLPKDYRRNPLILASKVRCSPRPEAHRLT